MHAYVVAVQYSDILSITLPYNRHHFDRVTVVTSPEDYPNLHTLVSTYRAEVVVTSLFYDNGATFNKWAALEYALDRCGRAGWLCFLDADVLWPKTARFIHGGQDTLDCFGTEMAPGCSMRISPGQLCTPLRRMFEDTSKPIPHEACWDLYEIHRNFNEWAGYSQIFHGSDPKLGTPPWHEVDWVHAGGADSFFQAKWDVNQKVRPPFEVLHIGEAGKNWYGRATPYLDGTLPQGSGERLERINSLWKSRRGRSGPDKFRSEKIT